MRNIRTMLALLIVILALTFIASYANAEYMTSSMAANNLDAPPSIAYLVIMTLSSTGQTYFHFSYHEVPDMSKCFELVKNSHIEIPSAGDAEAVVVMYCAPTRAKAWGYKEMRE